MIKLDTLKMIPIASDNKCMFCGEKGYGFCNLERLDLNEKNLI